MKTYLVLIDEKACDEEYDKEEIDKFFSYWVKCYWNRCHPFRNVWFIKTDDSVEQIYKWIDLKRPSRLDVLVMEVNPDNKSGFMDSRFWDFLGLYNC